MRNKKCLGNLGWNTPFLIRKYNDIKSARSKDECGLQSCVVFPKNISPPSSRSKNKTSKKPRGSRARLNFLPVSTGFFLGLPIDPEDGGDRFFRNVGISPKYTVQKTVLFIVTAMRT
jgi:hypothetical protein